MADVGGPGVRAQVGRSWRLVPGPASPHGAERSNNNCDLVRHAGRLWLAWRTAPTHFASALARIEVVSCPDPADGESGDAMLGPWRHERTVRHGRDVREPRFFAWRDHLHLTWFTAGTKGTAFQPDHVWLSRLDEDGWSEPVTVGPPDTVVWRVRPVGGELRMSVYRHAATLFTRHPRALEVQLWRSTDGLRWDTDVPVVHPGGSETEIIELPDGRVLAVVRKEGPEGGWGGDIGVAPVATADDPTAWRWTSVPRKLDSPLLFLHDGRPYLVCRKNLAFGGRYDLGLRRLPPQVQTRLYQGLYWLTPKRTVVYRVDEDGRTLDEVAELPSAGDTAFAAQVPVGQDRHLVVNYSSPLRPGWRPWIAGQLGATHLDVFEVSFTGSSPA